MKSEDKAYIIFFIVMSVSMFFFLFISSNSKRTNDEQTKKEAYRWEVDTARVTNLRTKKTWLVPLIKDIPDSAQRITGYLKIINDSTAVITFGEEK